jgi:hypothetical protein
LYSISAGLFCFTRFLRIHYAGRARLLKRSFILSMRLYARRTSIQYPVHARHSYSATRNKRRVKKMLSSRCYLRGPRCPPRRENARDAVKGGVIIKMYIRAKKRASAVERGILGGGDLNALQSLIILMCR